LNTLVSISRTNSSKGLEAVADIYLCRSPKIATVSL